MDRAKTSLAALERKANRIQHRLYSLSASNNSNRLMGLLLVIGGILVLAMSFRYIGVFSLIPVILICGFFVYNLGKGRKYEQSFGRHRAALQFAQHQIAREQLKWEELPPVPGREEDEPEHPFEYDLDISGQRSLHRLLNVGVSYEGIMRLRDWLLEQEPDSEEIFTRQRLVRDLTAQAHFRNRFLIVTLQATRFLNVPLDGDRILEWLEKNNEVRQSRTTLIVAVVLAALLYLSLILLVGGFLSPYVSALFIVLNAVWYLTKQNEQVKLSTDESSYLRMASGQLLAIFEFLEQYPYKKGSPLQSLCEPFFLHGDRRPSIQLKKFATALNRAGWLADPSVRFFLSCVIPLSAYTTYQIDQCKGILTEYLPEWLDAWYELEALCSLANFAYLNPEYTFPEIVVKKKDGVQPIVFDAKALGHPLIAKEHKVVNDFSLGEQQEVLLITGSNMAGKSTFLRTMGINLCLAYAGGVVNARSLRVSLFELYACIRVVDSLADGYSYFYAEVRRLKGLLEELDYGTPYPVFFLIDEIFRGTNNFERQIGSEAYIRSLLNKQCVGAVSTHDLEMARLADSFPQIRNYHFREHIIDGKMTFDYRLRGGPSPTRNALKIMEMEGLPVRWEGMPAALLQDDEPKVKTKKA
ncbi:MAG TPA: MutS family DNA mismatch repair protein [Dictyobacter sp.]|jgi:ABC-type multidrug transport system fused ATPase/permease subunit|nr:MutS family DNA mismatch repair protein [Dictyobacter sp.]